MVIQTTYTKVRTEFAQLWDEVVNHQDIVIVSKRGREEMALISVAELSSLLETAHLLSSSKNAERLLTALNRANAETIAPQTIAELRQEVRLDQET